MINDNIRNIIKRNFPRIEIVIAYGSAVFPQRNNIGKMTDLLFLVKNTRDFHKENLNINKKHYSTISSIFREDFITKVNSMGTGVYFNPMISLEDIYFKYGVIELETAYNQMKNWNSLFFSGRLHKPVVKIYPFDEAEKEQFEELSEKNVVNAFDLCVLKLPEKFTLNELYREIVELTYLGDIRTKVKAEVYNKADNIVHGGLEYFDALYKGVIDQHQEGNYITLKNREITISNPEIYHSSLHNLPYNFTNTRLNKELLSYDYRKRKEIIDKYISELNYYSSINGILSGIISTNPIKLFSYVFEKYKKSLFNRKI